MLLFFSFQNNTKYYVNVTVCLEKDSIPVLGSHVLCDHGIAMTLSSVKNETASAIKFIPYPRSGSWYIVMQSYCYNIDNATQKV